MAKSKKDPDKERITFTLDLKKPEEKIMFDFLVSERLERRDYTYTAKKAIQLLMNNLGYSPANPIHTHQEEQIESFAGDQKPAAATDNDKPILNELGFTGFQTIGSKDLGIGNEKEGA
ncbi:hypothetical protein [Enterococcus sp. BWR-S5]|uniref:hypothetical protein n=1 Tax=Enterococcus sp. BWR-S5 TaxID=2787714 RepID=UPI00192244AD|nr:hypothetical protein [Enterococcus sp. BWR-S5]MBL1227228.1 hypothetical protein [Enterococcus sp. BWR-S5]